MNESPEANVLEYGAKGDGITDDRSAIQRALDGRHRRILIPKGIYLLGETLTIESDTEIEADPLAKLVLADGAMHGPLDFLITNRHWDTGDRNITIRGGVWDYNNPGNRRGELFDPDSITGTMMHFHTVENLVLENLTLQDPECYYITTLDVKRFRFENILFDSPHLRFNQDGIHLGAGSEDGIIRKLRGTPGSPYDDVIAFSADNCMTRLQNRHLRCGDIRNILAEDIDCPACHTAVRIASVDSTVENITLRGIRSGCSHFFLNLDATHKSRTPIVFPEEERYHTGVGHVRNVSVSNCLVWSTAGKDPLIDIEENVQNLTLREITIAPEHVTGPDAPVLRVRLNGPTGIEMRGITEESVKSIKMKECDIRTDQETDSPDGKMFRIKIGKKLYGIFEMQIGSIPYASFNR